jgi:hypothetical protein
MHRCGAKRVLAATDDSQVMIRGRENTNEYADEHHARNYVLPPSTAAHWTMRQTDVWWIFSEQNLRIPPNHSAYEDHGCGAEHGSIYQSSEYSVRHRLSDRSPLSLHHFIDPDRGEG